MAGDFKKALIMSNDHSSAKSLKHIVLRSGIDESNLWMDDDPNYFMDIVEKEKITLIVIDWHNEPKVKEKIYQLLAEADVVYNFKVFILVKDLENVDKKYLKRFSVVSYMKIPYDTRALSRQLHDILTTTATSDMEVFSHIVFHMEQDHLEEAKELCVDFIKANEYKPAGPFFLGKVLVKMKRQQEAINQFKKAIKMDPNYVAAKESLAQVYIDMAQPEQARMLLKDLPVFGEKATAKNVKMGQICLAQGNLHEAKKYLEEALANDAGAPEVAEFHGLIAFQGGDVAKAKTLLKNSSHTKSLASHFNKLAISHIKSQRFEEGIKVYKDAMEVMPDKSKHHLLYFNIGMAYLRWKKPFDAEGNFIKALDLNPKYEKAKEYIEKIKKMQK